MTCVLKGIGPRARKCTAQFVPVPVRSEHGEGGDVDGNEETIQGHGASCDENTRRRNDFNLRNMPRTRTTQCGQTFSLGPRCSRISRMTVAESVHTREQHNTWSDKGRGKQPDASNAHRRQCAERSSSTGDSATALDKTQSRFSILCDAQKYTTCLDVHYSACLKHCNSLLYQNQRNGRDEDLLFVCLPPLLCPSLPSSATHDHRHGDMGITLEAHVCSKELT